MQNKDTYEVRAGNTVLYVGKDAEQARRVFFAAAKEQAYDTRKITFYVNGNRAAEFLEKPEFR
ncbi:hypothetical protein EI42_04482 [Thermosporothrix hazakensis]|jgi:hypothetical protein|uniref:Uncharacterized protein n=1 Tax=Thermosporothrix hazakensis TaxID=644383 RepID=A0A326U306_THEHA|nr:hypothetical protein [Thermosporothrix hazakensis]PZW24874.1 hypothetical protein EI42_04482 [Thermosporothrix hazakensis]GCE46438.1 hypothetical protein KTH_13070 [Thermosporothrix hazakensis]